MPTEPESFRPHTSLRIEADLWARFGAVAGRNRAALLREFIRWYLRIPGAKLPARPERTPD
jgi:hypothetical protein